MIPAEGSYFNTQYNLVLKEVLGRGRFSKSILCKHDEGLVLVKVYFKRGDFIDLRDYEQRLSKIRDIFTCLDHPHVWPFQFWLETDKAAYLLRQYFFNNLHDRLSTRPFLCVVEKKWLAFQLLYAVKQSHEHGVCHGDIKCENVLVTSWNWLYLADFASFKPTYIPHDDPSDFSFFFDTGGRRRCYLAPERFYEHGGEMHVAPDAPLKPSMDIFAVG
uniref:VPS15 n=1 Tax=Nicotiana benthamiana TaxID=4100 RepID=A0A173ADQ9_NICBE|nr:VPS15 [Nicotiana benthamiana]